MENQPNETLTTYECTGPKHRIFRRTKNNDMPCSRCGANFREIGTTTREPHETENHHQYRALSVKEQRVN